MEKDLLHVLEGVGYQGPLLQANKLSDALELGPKSTEYTGLVAWLASQIGTFINIDETINPTQSPDDASSFLLELSCFLKEIGCINQNLTTGNVNHRLADKGNRTLLLEILISELMACKLLQAKDPEVDKSLEVIINESDTARHLKDMLIALQFQKPPDNITPDMLFTRLENKLKEIISKVPNDLLGKPLFFGELSTDQWNKLSNYDKELHTEYEIRREMLLKRLDVTIQSFLWSERVKAQEKELNTRYHSGRSKMGTKPNVGIADLLAARDDLAVVEKTSNAAVRKNTRSNINKVIIGAVPDRGGRPYEQEPPPPEMPPWQKDRVAGPPTSGGYSRGGRGGSGSARGGGGRGGRGGSSYGNTGSYGSSGNSGGGGYGGSGNSGGGGYGGSGNSGGGGYGGSGNSGGGGYVNTGSGSGYGDGYGGSNNYSTGGGGGGNNYGGSGGSYAPGGGGGGGGGGGSNYNSSNYSGGASYGNNRGRGNYYNSGGTSNRSSGAYHDYNDAAGNYGQDYQRNSSRGGRVQGGWNQGGHNPQRNNYQRDGYNRGRGWGERQY